MFNNLLKEDLRERSTPSSSDMEHSFILNKIMEIYNENMNPVNKVFDLQSLVELLETVI